MKTGITFSNDNIKGLTLSFNAAQHILKPDDRIKEDVENIKGGVSIAGGLWWTIER